MPRDVYKDYTGAIIARDPDPANDGTFRKIKAVPDNLQKASDAFTEKVRKIGLETRQRIRVFTPEAIALVKNEQAAKIAEERQNLAATFEQIRTQCEADYEAALAICQKYLAPEAPKDSTESLLAEIRQQRAWQRQKGILDATDDTGRLYGTYQKLATDTAASGDADAIAALRAETPAYVQARGDDPNIYLQLLDAAEAVAEPWRAAVFQAIRDLQAGTYRVTLGCTYGANAAKRGEESFMAPEFDYDNVRTIMIDDSYQFTG